MCGYIDKSGKYRIEPIYDEVQDFSDAGEAWVRSQAKWLLIDRKGAKRFEPTFDEVRAYGTATLAREGQRWGVIDDKGMWLLPPQLDNPNSLSGVAVAVASGQMGFLDTKTWQWVIKPEYDKLEQRYGSPYLVIQKNKRSGLIKNDGSAVLPPEFEEVDVISEDAIAIKRDGKWGIANALGAMLIEPISTAKPEKVGAMIGLTINKTVTAITIRDGRLVMRHEGLDKVPYFRDGIAIIKTGGTAALLTEGGQIITPNDVTDITYDFAEGLVVAERKGFLRGRDNKGYLDKSGRWAIPPQFEYALSFSNGRAKVYRQFGGSFIIDKAGIRAFSENISELGEFKSGLACAVLDGKTGVFKESGAWLLKPSLEQAYDCHVNPFTAKRGNRWGLHHHDGTWAIEPTFESISVLTPQWYSAKSNGQYGLIDKTGTWILPAEHDDIRTVTEHVAVGDWRPSNKWVLVKKGELWTLATPVRGILTPHWIDIFKTGSSLRGYKTFSAFSGAGRTLILGSDGSLIDTLEGDLQHEWGMVHFARHRGKFGLLDQNGRWLVEPKFDRVGGYADDYTFVALDGKWRRINSKGDYLDETAFEEISEEASEGLTAVKIDGLWGYSDKNWKIVIPPMYSEAAAFLGGVALVTFGEQRGYINASGQPLTFDALEYKAQTSPDQKSVDAAACTGLLHVAVNVAGKEPEKVRLSATAITPGIRVKASRNFLYAYGVCSATKYSLTVGEAAVDPATLSFQFELDAPANVSSCEIDLYPTGGDPRVHCTP